MASVYFYTFLSVILVSAASFIGVFFLIIKADRLRKIIIFLVSLAAGTMLGDAALHLLPEVVETSAESLSPWLWFLSGILLFFALEKIIHWHHCHDSQDCEHVKTLGVINLVGDGMHNFIDGAIIAGSFLISPQLGLATSIAVIAHEIPQEIGDLGVLVHAGYSRNRALFLNFLSALLAILGAVITLSIGNRIENFNSFILPITAGVFIYIATADLLPELKKYSPLSKTLEQLAGIIIGIMIMLLLKQLD